MWIGTLNNPDMATAEEYLKLWHTKGKAVYVTGQVEKGLETAPSTCSTTSTSTPTGA